MIAMIMSFNCDVNLWCGGVSFVTGITVLDFKLTVISSSLDVHSWGGQGPSLSRSLIRSDCMTTPLRIATVWKMWELTIPDCC